jgi:cell division protein FtsL
MTAFYGIIMLTAITVFAMGVVFVIHHTQQ